MRRGRLLLDVRRFMLHGRGGFDLVLLAIAAVAAVLFISVQAFVFLVLGAERERRLMQPAE